MTYRSLIGLLGVGAIAVSALLQAAYSAEKPAAGKCYIDGMAFSAGAVARVGTKPARCSPQGIWQQTEAQTAGCIHASAFYATGTRMPFGDPAKQMLECLSDGTWSPVPREPKAASAR